MKGQNEIRFNQATIVDAVQEYLAKRYTPTPKVESVEWKSESRGYGNDGSFVVLVTEQPPEAPRG